MKLLKNNLLVQYSVVSFVVIIGLAVLLSTVLSTRLGHNIELLKEHGAAMMGGHMIKPTDPYSIPNLAKEISNLQSYSYVLVGSGFIFLYSALVFIVWHGWRTIRHQRDALGSVNADLESGKKELECLHEIGQTILSSLDLKTVLDKILDQTLLIASFDIGVIRLLDASNQILEPVVLRGFLDPKGVRMHRVRDATTGKILSRVITLNEAEVVENVADCDGLRTLKREGVQSAILLPVRTKDEVLGVMQLGSRTPRRFQSDEVRLLEAIGNQVGIAVQKARLYEEAKKQEEIQRLLKELSQNITSLDIDSLLKKLTEKVREFFEGDICDVRLIEGGKWRLEGISGIDPNQIPDAWGASRRRSLWIVENRRPLMIPDITKEPTRDAGKSLGPMGIQGYLGVPIFSRRREVIGVLRVLTYQPREFSQEEIDLLQQLASGAAIAIENARLFKEIRASQGDLEKSNVELARSNGELEQFAYVASHDLQAPMRKIQTFGERLKTECGDALGDQGLDYLERMHNAAARMQSLINDLLAYARITTKGQPFVPVDLTKVAREVLSDLEVHVEQADGRVELGGLWTLDADPGQMRQLLQNLISNALKFHKEGEPPVVKVHSHPLDGHGSSTGNGSCQIVVEDNGIGFDEKYLDRIFATFQRLHGRNEYEGSGIGLAVCRKIAEHHGGSITAKSTPGQGAAFIVTLPVQQMKQPTGEADNGDE